MEAADEKAADGIALAFPKPFHAVPPDKNNIPSTKILSVRPAVENSSVPACTGSSPPIAKADAFVDPAPCQS